MLAIKTLMACAALAAAMPAMASKVTLDFETLPNATRVGEAYKDLGIHFSSNAFNFVSKDGSCGGPGNFFDLTNTHSIGCNAIELYTGSTSGPTGASFYITVDTGFTGPFSLVYTATSAGTVSLYDSLAFLTDPDARPLSNERALSPQPTTDCILSGFQCIWDTKTVELGAQTAKYVVISGINGSMFLDNITFGNVNDAGGTVPEPSGVALSLAALGALAYTRKRVQR